MFSEKRFVKGLEHVRQHARVPLRVKLWNGRQFDLCADPRVTVTIPNASALRYFISPSLSKLGEAFVEGHIEVQGTARDVFKVAEGLARSLARAEPRLFHWGGRHSRHRDREAIRYHYDVSDDFYALFLDRNMIYSCAYFRSEADTLDLAQEQKLDHILTKLRLQPGERFLDIGCGWGGLIIRAAQQYGALATGITLSKNQFERAQQNIDRAGLHDRCRVLLLDYRDLPGSDAYDKIASVGMFEHVGLKNLKAYFETIHGLMKPQGLLLNHGITSSDVTNRWVGMGAGEFIDRYVFPDGELPHLSLLLKETARAQLEVLDVESLRRHYARTCEVWSDRLEANQLEAQRMAGQRRCRIWQMYLAGCAHGFSNGWMNLYQVLCSRAEDNDMGQHPLTRDYMYGGGAKSV